MVSGADAGSVGAGSVGTGGVDSSVGAAATSTVTSTPPGVVTPAVLVVEIARV